MRTIAIAITLLAGCERAEPAPASASPSAEVAPTDELAEYEGEARVQLSKLYDSVSAFYAEEHITRDQVAAIGRGEAIANTGPRECPNDGRASGSTPITPPLAVDCASGPDKKCWPSRDASSAGHYRMAAWTDEKAWNGLNFQLEHPHRFHYRYRWDNKDGGCEFAVQAIGRGTSGFKIFERRGTLTPDAATGSELIVRDVTRAELGD